MNQSNQRLQKFHFISRIGSQEGAQTPDALISTFLNNFQSDLDQKKAVLSHKSQQLKERFGQTVNQMSSDKAIQIGISSEKEHENLNKQSNTASHEETQKIWVNLEEISKSLENNLQFFPLPTINNLFQISGNKEHNQEQITTQGKQKKQKKFPAKMNVAMNSRSKKVKSRKKIPKDALEVLRGWLDKNIDDPYPSNETKHELAKKVNLDFKQVHNWFINARGRTCKSIIKSEKFGNLVEKTYMGKKAKALPQFLTKLD